MLKVIKKSLVLITFDPFDPNKDGELVGPLVYFALQFFNDFLNQLEIL